MRQLPGFYACCAALLGFTLGTAHARAQEASRSAPSIQYTVHENDTMCLIATMYYSAPSAYVELYVKNRDVLEKAHRQFARNNPRLKKRTMGPSTIYPGTVIDIPAELGGVNRILYSRRPSPMDREFARNVASEKGIDLDDLGRATRDRLPMWLGKTRKDVPSSGYTSVKQKAAAALREPTPAWFTNPEDSISKCAKSVCERFGQLCYFECLGVAKRFLDGDVSCLSLPNSLPYEVDDQDRTCADLLE